MPADDPNEFFYLVDEDDNEIGKIRRSEAHADKTKIHRSAYVVITNSQNNLLLQKRSLKKDLQLGFWGMSVGGHLEYGQTYEEAAKREMKEELGIELPIKFVRKKLIESPDESEFSAIFVTTTDETPTDFDRDEIDEVKWVPVNKLTDFIMDEKVSYGAKEVMKTMNFV